MHPLQKFSAVHASLHNSSGTERHPTQRTRFKAHCFAAPAERRTLAAWTTAGEGRAAPSKDKLASV